MSETVVSGRAFGGLFEVSGEGKEEQVKLLSQEEGIKLAFNCVVSIYCYSDDVLARFREGKTTLQGVFDMFMQDVKGKKTEFNKYSVSPPSKDNVMIIEIINLGRLLYAERGIKLTEIVVKSEYSDKTVKLYACLGDEIVNQNHNSFVVELVGHRNVAHFKSPRLIEIKKYLKTPEGGIGGEACLAIQVKPMGISTASNIRFHMGIMMSKHLGKRKTQGGQSQESPKRTLKSIIGGIFS
ncbi:MAG: putative matrix protein [Alphanucleorhabdovirus xinjianensis]|uniref:Matrix protein n=1 Tax=Xinjiang nucleorhabdovirus TaxID=2824629 RepID=A0AAE7WE26_9RHAB|nr:MAG: putative matrix protein [Xinjiang nucleorhabdovirus]